MNTRSDSATRDATALARRHPRGAQVFVLLALFASVAGEASAEQYLPKLGGPGGSQFNDPCPAGQNLTGFELRGGDDVDAIRPVCVLAYGPHAISEPVLTTDSGLVPLGPQGHVLGGAKQQVAPGWHGGPGGQIQRLLCPARTPIVLGIDVQSEGIDTITVNAINLFCGEAVGAQTAEANPSNLFEGTAYVPSSGWLGIGVDGESAKVLRSGQRCPKGLVAVGLHGRSGTWLDAMGLICDTPRIASQTADGRPVVDAKAKVKPAQPSGPPPSICDAAREARARNSPAAPGLEAQCRALDPVVAAGAKVKSSQPSGPPIPICDAAGAARDRNSPAAPGLEAQCRALGGHLPARATDGAPSADELAAKGAIVANGDALSAALREQQPDGPVRRGFDIGMAAAEGQTEWGPGKQKLLDSLGPGEQEGFKVAVSFSLDRNRNIELASTGAAIVDADPIVAKARTAEPDARYWLGFDIASGIFGDSALGARGNTATGPGSLAIRDALSAPAQRGFDSSVKLHLSRKY